MDRNIKIAKQLVKLAKELVSVERNAKWDWKHPFSFTKKSQEENEIKDCIKQGKPCNGVIMLCTSAKKFKYTRSGGSGGDGGISDEVCCKYKGEIKCPINLKDQESKILDEIEYNSSFSFNEESGGKWSVTDQYGESLYGRRKLFPEEIEIDGQKIKVVFVHK